VEQLETARHTIDQPQTPNKIRNLLGGADQALAASTADTTASQTTGDPCPSRAR
jgi:hypothetical protein